VKDVRSRFGVVEAWTLTSAGIPLFLLHLDLLQGCGDVSALQLVHGDA
jgi:hypothetical protein